MRLHAKLEDPHLGILPQFGDFDPEAHPDVKKLPDPRNFDPEEFQETSYLDPNTNYIKKFLETI